MLAVTTLLVLTAFAANSLLCRMALEGGGMDVLDFTLLRLGSAAIFLWLLVGLSALSRTLPGGALVSWPNMNIARLSWASVLRRVPHGLALGIYALSFSMAYLALDAGLGALILFATLQISLNILALLRGAAYSLQLLLALCVSLGGLVFLLWPQHHAQVSDVNMSAVVLMMLAGLGWAAFVDLGTKSQTAFKDVTLGFSWAALMCGGGWLWSEGVPSDMPSDVPVEVVLALLSGVLTSGLGYVIWYLILPRLGTQMAAQLQLLVPVIALMMGYVFLDEVIGWRTLTASAMILAGVFWALKAQSKQKDPTLIKN